jgi:hypothetical protein
MPLEGRGASASGAELPAFSEYRRVVHRPARLLHRTGVTVHRIGPFLWRNGPHDRNDPIRYDAASRARRTAWAWATAPGESPCTHSESTEGASRTA